MNRLVWHTVGFLCILIPLVVLGSHNSAEFVFTSTADADSWPNYGIAFCIGLTVNTFPFVGMPSLFLNVFLPPSLTEE